MLPRSDQEGSGLKTTASRNCAGCQLFPAEIPVSKKRQAGRKIGIGVFGRGRMIWLPGAGD